MENQSTWSFLYDELQLTPTFAKVMNCLAEAAMLAGIIKGPEYYSPYLNFDRAKTLEIILNTMAKSISKDEADAVLNLVVFVNTDYKAPYFTDYVFVNWHRIAKGAWPSEEEAQKAI